MIAPFLINSISVVLSAIFSWIFLKFLLPILERINLKDLPNERSSHEKVKLNAGGIAFIFTTLIGSFLRGDFSLVTIIPIAIIGFLDDKFKISSLFRFLAQATTVIFLINDSIFFESLKINNQPLLNNLILISLILIGIALINFINFMDGMDGLVGSATLPAIFYGSISFYQNGFLLFGALVGFLLWNWSPSKVFMGDTGSLFIGSFLSLLIFKSENPQIGFSIIFLLSPLILDSGVTILKRFLNKENIFIAHKSHLYQRLYQNGFSHSRVSILYLSSTLFLFILNQFFGFYSLLGGTFIIAIFGLYLNNKYVKI